MQYLKAILWASILILKPKRHESKNCMIVMLARLIQFQKQQSKRLGWQVQEKFFILMAVYLFGYPKMTQYRKAFIEE